PLRDRLAFIHQNVWRIADDFARRIGIPRAPSAVSPSVPTADTAPVPPTVIEAATFPPARLRLECGGWCLRRIPPDPAPTDEPRGVSGYTYAFGDEPDLDRIIRFQVTPEDAGRYIRSHSPEIGVFVTGAACQLRSGD